MVFAQKPIQINKTVYQAITSFRKFVMDTVKLLLCNQVLPQTNQPKILILTGT